MISTLIGWDISKLTDSRVGKLSAGMGKGLLLILIYCGERHGMWPSIMMYISVSYFPFVDGVNWLPVICV